MGDIEAAIAAIKSLSITEKVNLTKIAEEYSVERSTLSRRYRGITQSKENQNENQRHLNKKQESELVQYIERLCLRGIAPTRQMIKNFASEVVQKPLGNHWVDRFIKRHQIDLVSRWTSGLDSNRHQADSAFKYSLYFELIGQKISQYNIEPRHIYNMDEKGFLLGVLSKQKRIFSRSLYEEGKLKKILQDGNREWITTIACICADGTALSPSLIYQAASGNLQDSWLQDFNPEIHNTFFASSPSGWTNNEIGLAWLKQVFNRETASKARLSYRLLILDGHGSHVTREFLEYCDSKKILIAIYPPHSTHTLQPLDVCLFSPLATAYRNQISEFLERCQGLTSITKRDFYSMFYAAWTIAFQKSTILRSFEVTGLSPWNPDIILQRFQKRQMSKERPSSSSSGGSSISASDWRKIQRLLKAAVDDMNKATSKKLSSQIHQLSVQYLIVKYENDQLKEALVNEKKRRKRGKPLQLQQPEDYHGGAVFWSPTKIREARDQEEQQAYEEIEIQQQKAEAVRLREERKAEKALQLQNRKDMRASAREIRLQDQAKKKAEKEERKVTREVQKQLQNDIKSSKKGKRIASKKEPPVEPVDEAVEAVVVEYPTSSKSRRGRNINPPQRYLT